ncbi:MAG: hypothetical protein IKY82_05470 [Alistipes sp.]|nr:hypothetical protein [Alistipes sp.]
MSAIYTIITATLLLATILISLRTALIIKAVRHRKFFIDEAAGCCESLGFVGCSVICHTEVDMDLINHLLQSEYDRHEVVAALDSRLAPEEFYSIVEHFGMISVNPTTSNELKGIQLRALYRSRQRCYKRFVLIDAASTSPYDALNCATAVASFDYILPLPRNSRLHPYAIESAAMVISEQGDRGFDFIRCTADKECYILRREYIIQQDGFSASILGGTPRRNIISTAIPIAYSSESNKTIRRRLALYALGALGPFIVAGAFLASAPIIIATLLTAAFVALLARYSSQYIGTEKCSERVMLCYIRNLFDIFCLRKFTF